MALATAKVQSFIQLRHQCLQCDEHLLIADEEGGRRQIWDMRYEMTWDMIWCMIYIYEIWHNDIIWDMTNGCKQKWKAFRSPCLRYVVLLYRTCIEDIGTTQTMANPQQPNSELQRRKGTCTPCSIRSLWHVNRVWMNGSPTLHE